MELLTLPKRNEKPRKAGISAIHDVSLSTGELKNILDDYSEFLDIAKLGVGSAYVTPKLKEKIKLYKDFGIEVYFGGTLFEKFYHQNKLPAYKDYLVEHGITMVEISCGTLEISIEERIEILRDFKRDFSVLAEVGSKDGDAIMPPSIWIKELKMLLDAGATYVITEGRNSGTAGVYRPSGEIRTGLVSDIISSISPDKIIFEAPTSQSQMFFINQVGSNVNLGNIRPNDLLLLESQRRGLRSETFMLEK